MGDTLEEYKARNRQFFEARRREHRLEVVLTVAFYGFTLVTMMAILAYFLR